MGRQILPYVYQLAQVPHRGDYGPLYEIAIVEEPERRSGRTAVKLSSIAIRFVQGTRQYDEK